MDINEPVITTQDEMLFVNDAGFNPGNVIVVTGAATGIGRATCIAAVANGLMIVGLDFDETEGKCTVEMARAMGGQMIVVPRDLTKDKDMMVATVGEAAKLGTIQVSDQRGWHPAHQTSSKTSLSRSSTTCSA